MTVQPDPVIDTTTAPRSRTPSTSFAKQRGARRGHRRVPAGLAVTLTLLLIIVVVSILAPLLSSADPLRQAVEHRFEGPSATHWLGTDEIGRDFLVRIIWGARSAFEGVLITLGVTALIGVPWGLLAGYAGGIVDEALMRIADALLSFPGIVLAIAITGSLGPSLVNAMISVGVVFSPIIARLLRSSVLPVRRAEFVLVARSLGASRLRVSVRHVLPNAMAPVLVQLCALASIALLIETALAFLGLGVQPPFASWGGDLADAYQNFTINPLLTVVPGVATVLAAFLMSRVGDGLRDLLGTR